jgi:hypothetical protein
MRAPRQSLLRLPCVGRRHADMLTEKGLVSAEKLREVCEASFAGALANRPVTRRSLLRCL